MSETPDRAACNGSEEWIHNTRLFREWEKVQKEIQLHKWYKSEQAGHDIGWERAAVDWMIHYGGGKHS